MSQAAPRSGIGFNELSAIYPRTATSPHRAADPVDIQTIAGCSPVPRPRRSGARLPPAPQSRRLVAELDLSQNVTSTVLAISPPRAHHAI